MDLIDEEDRVVALGHLLDHVLQTLLELAAVPGKGCAGVQGGVGGHSAPAIASSTRCDVKWRE